MRLSEVFRIDESGDKVKLIATGMFRFGFKQLMSDHKNEYDPFSSTPEGSRELSQLAKQLADFPGDMHEQVTLMIDRSLAQEIVDLVSHSESSYKGLLSTFLGNMKMQGVVPR